jgi:hypothetical protein
MKGADGALAALSSICNAVMSQNEQARKGAEDLAACARQLHNSVSDAAALLSDAICALEEARGDYDELLHKSSARSQSIDSPKIQAKLAAYEAEARPHPNFHLQSSHDMYVDPFLQISSVRRAVLHVQCVCRACLWRCSCVFARSQMTSSEAAAHLSLVCTANISFLENSAQQVSRAFLPQVANMPFFPSLHHSLFSTKPPKQSSAPCSSANPPPARTRRFQTPRAPQVSHFDSQSPILAHHAFPRRYSITCQLLPQIHVGFPVIFVLLESRCCLLRPQCPPSSARRLRSCCRLSLQRHNRCARPRIRVQQQELCRLRSVCCGVIERVWRAPVFRASHDSRKPFQPHPTPPYRNNCVGTSLV